MFGKGENSIIITIFKENSDSEAIDGGCCCHSVIIISIIIIEQQQQLQEGRKEEEKVKPGVTTHICATLLQALVV